jgi:hypothetical protein
VVKIIVNKPMFSGKIKTDNKREKRTPKEAKKKYFKFFNKIGLFSLK